ncbi:hypothetical protein FSP39_011367 [Pinctada imbricata]|uniref:Transglutaminase-like domain-containing protein n=1 Tax=Pinctada imbricata TaxID=66713 RepID=A0AA88Y054_PINIB|nr:hypothetical protein FSP39_011367 [Pinctada imbricata]
MGCGSSQAVDASGPPAKGKDSSDVIETDITYVYTNSTQLPKSNHNQQNKPHQEPIKPPIKNHSSPAQVKAAPKHEPISIESLDEDASGPKPSWRNKSEIIPNPTTFAEIEAHVAKTPASACTSINELASYLVKHATKPIHKLKAIHRWVTTNIQYDTEGYFSGNYKPSDGGSVLKNRTSVCQGYGELFAALCREAHIQVKVIQGVGKGYGYKPLDEVDLGNIKTNHAWNAVLLDGEWRLVDCTWDAGYVDKNKNFTWKKGDHYFLTDPEDFVNSHFPLMKGDYDSSKQWQLLSKPLDAATFFSRLKLQDFAFQSDLELLSHKDTVISVNREVEILVRRSEGEYHNISAHLDDTSDGSSHDQYVCLLRKNRNCVSVRVRPPHAATFKLRLYGSINSEEKQNHPLCDYYIKCNSVATDLQPYAKHFGIWGPKPNFQEFGFAPEVADKVEYETGSGEVDIVLKTNRDVSVLTRLESSDGKEVEGGVLTEAQGSDISLSVRMPSKGYYRLLIFAPDKSGKNKDVISYHIHCKNAPGKFDPYPTSYFRQVKEHATKLLEPKTRTIPANSDVRFQFSSSLVTHVQILSKSYWDEKSGDLWNLNVKTPDSGTDLTIFGGKKGGGVSCLYTFKVV